MAKLGDICVKIDNIESSYDDMIEYIDISSVDNNKKKIVSTQTIDYSEAPSRAKQLIQNGDILVSNVRPNLNAVALVDIESDKTLVASTGYTVIRCNNKAYNKYVFFFCQYSGFVDLLTQQATGASYPAVNSGIIKSTPIPLPPLETQRKIASNLDKVTHTIDLCNAILEKLDLLVKSRFVEMFGDVKLNSMNWEEGVLSDFFEVKGGKRIPKGMTYSDKKTVHPYLRATDMKNETILDDDIHYIDDCVFEHIRRYTVNSGDIYLTNVGVNLGMAGVIPSKYDGANLTENAVKLMPKTNRFIGRFIAMYINSPGIQEYILERKMTVGVPKLAIFRIETMPLIIPPIALQKEFLTFREQTDKSKSAVKKLLEKAETLKKALMQEYFG